MRKTQKEFVYIVLTPSGQYFYKHAETVEEHLQDMRSMERVSYKLVRAFIVSENSVSKTLIACSDFTRGYISLKDLEKIVDSLSD